VGLPGKRLGLQFVLIYFVATSHITSSTIPNCFSVDCLCHRGRYLQFFLEIYHKYLGFMEFVKYVEWGKFAASVEHPKAKRFSASGGKELQGALPPDPLTRGSAPGPHWGLRPQTPVIGRCSAVTMSVHPTFFDLATPLITAFRLRSPWWFANYSVFKSLVAQRVFTSMTRIMQPTCKSKVGLSYSVLPVAQWTIFGFSCERIRGSWIHACNTTMQYAFVCIVLTSWHCVLHHKLAIKI